MNSLKNHMKIISFVSIKELIIIKCVILLLGTSINAQINNDLRDLQNVESGRCYSKCNEPDHYEEFNKTYAVYIGDLSSLTTEYLDSIIINEHERNLNQGKWIQKKTDKGDLIYCLVSCIFEPEYLTVVTDTSKTDDYVYENFTFYRIIEYSKMVWKEVVCEEEITGEMIKKVQLQLNSLGFYNGPINGLFTDETKKSLMNFQIEMNICTGSLTLETLNKLGVIYD